MQAELNSTIDHTIIDPGQTLCESETLEKIWRVSMFVEYRSLVQITFDSAISLWSITNFSKNTTISAEFVAQFKSTLLLLPNGTVLCTGIPIDTSFYQSEHSPDEEMTKLLAELPALVAGTSASKNKKKKKKSSTSAGDKENKSESEAEKK